MDLWLCETEGTDRANPLRIGHTRLTYPAQIVKIVQFVPLSREVDLTPYWERAAMKPERKRGPWV